MQEGIYWETFTNLSKKWRLKLRGVWALVFAALVPTPSVAEGDTEEQYFGPWKVSRFYGVCSVSLRSADKNYEFSLMAIGSHPTTTIYLPASPREAEMTRVSISFIFEDGTESHARAILSYEEASQRDELSIFDGYNLVAMTENRIVDLYVDGEMVTTFELQGGNAAITSWSDCIAEVSRKYPSN